MSNRNEGPVHSRFVFRLILGGFLLAGLGGGYFAWREGRGRAGDAGGGSVPLVRFCTNPGATTPQLPVWAAVQADAAGAMFRLHIETWREPGHLQASLLAGEGDIWLGHTEGFARARAQGAPVVLVAVTGWRKMSVVSFDPAVRSPRDLLDRSLPYAPKGSPAVPLLRSLLGAEADRVRFEPQENRQIAILLGQRKIQSALLPEPLVTTLLDTVPDLRLAFMVEEAYAERNRGLARLPWAGLAVHERILREHPERVAALVAGMREAVGRLNADLDAAATVLPAEFAETVAPAAVRSSLERDLILVEEAASVRDELRAYYELACPETFAAGSVWFEQGFLWESGVVSRP